MSHATDSYDDDNGCAVLRRYIYVCNSDVVSVVNMYPDNLMFCVVCINGLKDVSCSECYVVSNECAKPPLTCATYRLCTLGVLGLGITLMMIYACVL